MMGLLQPNAELPRLWIILALLSLTAILYQRTKRHRLHYPPGPKGLPVIGNWFDMLQERPWIVFKQWSEQYGAALIA